MCTISEKYFIELCREKSVVCKKIPETDERMPDYRVLIGSMELITEVKQLDPTSEDKERAKTWDTPESCGASDATRRVRKKLDHAYPQVERLALNKCPTMIVIYNNAGEWNLLNGFAVGSAMFGTYGFVFEQRPHGSIEVSRQGHLGKRRVTEGSYRALSAVGILTCTGSRVLELTCYHNPFARVSAEPRTMARLCSAQYVKPDPHEGRVVHWQWTRLEA